MWQPISLQLKPQSPTDLFRLQDEALRPFVNILRLCDAPQVRELAVQCVTHAINVHPQGLDSGALETLDTIP